MARELVGLLGIVLAFSATADEPAGHHVLFIGNSYTFRSHLPDIVKALALAGHPDEPFEVTSVVYGGQTLKTHWELYRSYNMLRLPKLSATDLQAELDALQKAKDESQDQALASRLNAALANHRKWLAQAGQPRPPFDLVVLQSWRDQKGGLDSDYAVYARKFAAEIRAQGGRPVLYATTPETQNAQPLEATPDPSPVEATNRFLQALGAELDAIVIPMAAVAHRCQTERPDITLRYVNDGHPNQTMAYLTASTFYAALFNASPEGLAVETVTDDRVKIPEHPDQNPDGGPQIVTFPADLLAFLQRTAWQGLQDYRQTKPE